ncbi:MAG: PKD domain-containing protein, partial [Thaumarchaeota archaeon]|nr:PKD domain-containing protein [Nitrososphaerota archaeon]
MVLFFSGMVEDSFAQTVVAYAGPDQTVGSGATVTLDGTGSSDFLTHNYRWSEPTGSISFSGFDEIQPTFTAPTAPATLTITLTVSGGGRSAADTVIITVSDTPTANAGSNQNVNRGAIVTLDGTGSTDPNGDTLNYSWLHTSGPSVSLSSATVAQPTFTPTSLGTIVFTLTVSDGTLSDTDTVSITILNQPPTANAGPDKTFAPKSTVTLNGSGTDPDNDPLTYTWSQDSGTPVIITDATSARTTFTAPADPTELVFTLTVEDDTDTNTDTDTDTITITIAKTVTRNIKEMSETLISATITA